MLGQESASAVSSNFVVVLLNLAKPLAKVGGQFTLGLQLFDFLEPVSELFPLLYQCGTQFPGLFHAPFGVRQMGLQGASCLLGGGPGAEGEVAVVEGGKSEVGRSRRARHKGIIGGRSGLVGGE